MLNVYHSLAHQFCFFLFFFPSSASTSEIVSVMTESGSLVITLPDVVITTDVVPHHWVFYFQGYGYIHL